MENIDSKEQAMIELKRTIANSNDYIFNSIDHIEDLVLAVQNKEIDLNHFITKIGSTARKMKNAHEKLKVATKVINLL